MKIDIGSNIFAYLERYNKVNIPGLGRFIMSDKDSDFTFEGHSISPPKSKILFDEISEVDNHFSEYLSKKYEISNKKADNHINRYAQDLLNSVLNYGAASLPKIGKIVKKSNSGLSFIPDESEHSSKKYFYLPTIHLTPIIPDEIEADTEEIVAIAAPVAIIEEPFVEPIVIENEPILIENRVEEVVNEEIIEVHKPLTLNEKLGAQIQPEVNPIITKSQPVLSSYENNSGLLWSILSVLGLILLSAFLWKKCNAPQPANGITGGVETTANDTLNAISMGIGKTPLIWSDSALIPASDAKIYAANLDTIQKKRLLKYSNVLTKEALDVGCVIICGSFRSARNATIMKDKIIREGYQPYSEVFGNYTRVGFLFNCVDYDLVDYLQETRRKFNNPAWYLVPELEVAAE